MKKELRPFHDAISCHVCGRTMLKGERTEAYLAPGGHRYLVCDLCLVRADRAGWIREAAADALPTRAQRPYERRTFLGRLRRPRASDASEQASQVEPAATGEPGEHSERAVLVEDPHGEPALDHDQAEAPAPPARRGPRREPPQDPRHVRAVPTTAEAKVQRALDLFNASEHQRVVAGLTRTLGYPWATAVADPESPSAVTVVVAWELSWYRYRIDLGDTTHAVSLQEKGEELQNIDERLRQWNAGLDADGRLGVEGAET